MSIRQVCEAFCVSQGCFRYAPKLSSDNARIAELLLGLAQSQRKARQRELKKVADGSNSLLLLPAHKPFRVPESLKINQATV